MTRRNLSPQRASKNKTKKSECGEQFHDVFKPTHFRAISLIPSFPTLASTQNDLWRLAKSRRNYAELACIMLFFSKKTTLPPESATASLSVPLMCDMTDPFPFEIPARQPPARDRLVANKTQRLKRQLRTAQRALGRVRVPIRYVPRPSPECVAPTPAAPTASAPQPAAFDPALVTGLVAQSPVLVELQYEVLDLRHEMEALKKELASLRAKLAEPPAEVKTQQLSVTDSAGKVVARISGEGVVSCQRFEFHQGAL